MTKSKRVMTFSVGDLVTWKSQANGSVKTKKGIVVEVVPANKFPKKGPSRTGAKRGHESYVVEVSFTPPKPSKKPRAVKKPEIYWPVAGNLRLVKRGSASVLATVEQDSAPKVDLDTDTVSVDTSGRVLPDDSQDVGFRVQRSSDFDTTDVSSEERPIADLESLPDDDQPMQVDAADEHSADDPYPAAVVNAIEGGGDPSNVESSAN